MYSSIIYFVKRILFPFFNWTFVENIFITVEYIITNVAFLLKKYELTLNVVFWYLNFCKMLLKVYLHMIAIRHLLFRKVVWINIYYLHCITKQGLIERLCEGANKNSPDFFTVIFASFRNFWKLSFIKS